MDFELYKLVRPNILALEPYSCARNEFSGQAQVYLDANESPFNSPYNRYPDPLQLALKQKISKLKGVPVEQIFLGNGSDECIDLMYRIFCEPGKDEVVAISPSYGMYKVCAHVNDVRYVEVLLDKDFGLAEEMMKAAYGPCTKLMWICSPNNPTGNSMDVEQVRRLLELNCIVVVDEAYIDFSSQPSMLHYLDKYPNLVVLQTFSKAWGSAGARLGMAFASRAIIELMNKVKYPYNINILTQQYALDRISHRDEVEQQVAEILGEREWLIEQIKGLKCVRHIHHTDANFVLVAVDDADKLYRYLLDKGTVVRNRNRVEKCEGCLRITVGTHNENETLICQIVEYEQQ